MHDGSAIACKMQPSYRKFPSCKLNALETLRYSLGAHLGSLEKQAITYTEYLAHRLILGINVLL